MTPARHGEASAESTLGDREASGQNSVRLVPRPGLSSLPAGTAGSGVERRGADRQGHLLLPWPPGQPCGQQGTSACVTGRPRPPHQASVSSLRGRPTREERAATPTVGGWGGGCPFLPPAIPSSHQEAEARISGEPPSLPSWKPRESRTRFPWFWGRRARPRVRFGGCV